MDRGLFKSPFIFTPTGVPLEAGHDGDLVRA